MFRQLFVNRWVTRSPCNFSTSIYNVSIMNNIQKNGLFIRSMASQTMPFEEHSKTQTKVSENDDMIKEALNKALSPELLEVEDQSCGCGAFYRIKIISDKFQGQSMLKQHKLVKSALGDIMKELHGVTLETSKPK